MRSTALIQWQGARSAVLDEIEAAHALVGGTGPGRRYATQQLNRAYALLLSSEFQGFARDIHSESADQLVAATPVATRALSRAQYLWGRQLSRGNPQSGAIGSDFGRLGLVFWDQVYALNAPNQRRRELLDELVAWRNAIAHNDFDPAIFGNNPVLHLVQVRAWRRALNLLAQAFDSVMYNYLTGLLGVDPWPP